MTILISGSSGLIGSALVPALTAQGHRVSRLMRSKSGLGARDFYWDPDTQTLDSGTLENLDAVVHLAGENIAGGRWTAARKARIRDSRIHGTRLISQTLSQLARPPKVLVSASAVGYYGDRGDEILNEASSAGTSFLAEVCREWEGATAPAALKGIRVVSLRLGVVLSPRGGALAKMLLPFRLGVGGVVGTGKQYMSWISMDDAVRLILHALETDSLTGPVNGVAPNPVTNREFTKTLGHVLKRPTIFPMPAFAARLAFGEMADALLLASQRVVPTKAQSSGFVFRDPQIEPALIGLLKTGKTR